MTGALSHAGPGDRDPVLRGHQQGNGTLPRASGPRKSQGVTTWIGYDTFTSGRWLFTKDLK